ncbi:hypothetical protein [Clostridium uliginosum]|uniref:Uncharacterized protein n=1 Tax=Clostridium uliginosum TaxID=119641 RepID=A0A1I1GRY4_9CLOT|nr:hypothetical protein [Clostridium uliginosum]SFC14251.1 hypothetical protein SAMN05421842_10138 [Clostridium uliginosum]
MADFDNLEDFFKSLENEDNMKKVLKEEKIEDKCPICKRTIKIDIDKNNTLKCPCCGAEFNVTELKIEQ